MGFEFTTPEVYVIAATRFDAVEANRFVMDTVGEDINATIMFDEYSAVNQSADMLTEFMGRLCYKSWAPEVNPNVTRIRRNRDEYIGNVLKQQHGSLFAHASMSFVFANVSRVFTHELVRHHVGTAISQESLRYVRLDDLKAWIPEELLYRDDGTPWEIDGVEAQHYYHNLFALLSNAQKTLTRAYGLDGEDVSFTYKKTITSGMRRVAPIGLATNIGFTANIRSLRKIIGDRTAPHAEVEIRSVWREVAEIVRDWAPACFQDMHEIEDGSFVFENGHVF